MNVCKKGLLYYQTHFYSKFDPLNWFIADYSFSTCQTLRCWCNCTLTECCLHLLLPQLKHSLLKMSGSRGCLNFVHPDPHLGWGRPTPTLAILTREPSPATSSLTGQYYVVLRPREDRPEPPGQTQYSCTLCFKYVVIWCCCFVCLFYSNLFFFLFVIEMNLTTKLRANATWKTPGQQSSETSHVLMKVWSSVTSTHYETSFLCCRYFCK